MKSFEDFVLIPRMDSYVVPDIDYSFLDKYCNHNRGAETKELFLTLISYILTSSDFLKDEEDYFENQPSKDIELGDISLGSWKKAQDIKSKRMVPINWKVLRYLWGAKSDELMKILRNEKIVIRSKKFIVGVVSYKYTLNKDKVAGHKRKRINFSSKIIEERFNRHRNNKITSLAKEHDIYKRLYNNVSSLVFDYESAREYANKLDPGLVKDSVHQRINAEENNFTIFKKDRNNRIYTNFTVTHRVLRTFYSFPNGEDIYMADISACHPWFFFSLYKEDSEEKQKFKSLFDADGFWNNLFFQLYGKKMIAEEKDVFKKKFFKYIGYSRTVAVLKQDIFIKFKETFPILSKLIDEKKNPSHADFANSNMQLESKIMFRAIELGNFTQFLWVHDALYSTEREIFNVVKILKQSFAQEGLFPQIEVKKITREKLSIQESIHNAPHALT